jgi:hypothetical protein
MRRAPMSNRYLTILEPHPERPHGRLPCQHRKLEYKNGNSGGADSEQSLSGPGQERD